jgi:hypothetical protein
MNARPQTHAGIARPAWKNAELVVVLLLSATPMPSTKTKYTSISSQSSQVSVMDSPSIHRQRLAMKKFRTTSSTSESAFRVFQK